MEGQSTKIHVSCRGVGASCDQLACLLSPDTSISIVGRHKLWMKKS